MYPNFKLDEYIMHHLFNSHEWHLPFGPSIHLPGFLSFHGLMVAAGSVMLLFIFTVVYQHKQRVPTGLTNCLEAFVMFIRDEIAIPNLGEKDGISFTPMLCTMFFFILILNLIGLVPLFGTATANVSVTGALAFPIFILLVVGTLIRNGPMGMWHALIPSSLPKFMIPFFLVIEVASLFIRCGALMIRLFANMLAGHMVIIAFLGLILLMGWFVFPFFFPLAVCIYGMEVFVAFLQAYIFVLLSAVFIGQMYHPNH